MEPEKQHPCIISRDAAIFYSTIYIKTFVFHLFSKDLQASSKFLTILLRSLVVDNTGSDCQCLACPHVCAHSHANVYIKGSVARGRGGEIYPLVERRDLVTVLDS